MPTIVIDCRFATLPVGLGRYTRELTTALLRRSDAMSYVLLVRSMDESWIMTLPKRPMIIQAPFPHYSLREQISLPGLLRKAKADLLFSPHFNIPSFSSIPFVVTIHDLILHHYPNAASVMKRIAYKTLIKRALFRSRSTIAVSGFVKDEIGRAYPAIDRSKIHVIHEGVDATFAPAASTDCDEVRARYRLPSSFFLYVGNAKQHKNVPFLINAFEKAKIPDTDLLLVTGGPEVTSLRLPSRVRLLSSVPDADLPALYSAARCFVTASHYEGFCLPVVEALACGCPVIACESGPLQEVTKGFMTLIEPTAEAFAQAFRSPPSDRTPHRLWKWEEAAEKTVRVLQESVQ